MRFRPLALFALTACLAVLAGEFAPADAQLTKQEKKNKKNKKTQPPPSLPPPAPATEDTKPIPPAKPLPTVVPAPTTRDAAALARLIDAEIAKKLTEAKTP